MAAGVVAQGVPSFYTPPSLLTPGTPGELIAAEPIDAPEGVSAWRILYHSQLLDGTDTAVSGMVAVPAGSPPTGGFPLLAVAHATTGIARACAPSIDPASSTDLFESFYTTLRPFLNAGYAVAATDYQGLGAPNPPA